MEKMDAQAHVQLEHIKNVLANFKDGASLEEILAASGLRSKCAPCKDGSPCYKKRAW